MSQKGALLSTKQKNNNDIRKLLNRDWGKLHSTLRNSNYQLREPKYDKNGIQLMAETEEFV